MELILANLGFSPDEDWNLEQLLKPIKGRMQRSLAHQFVERSQVDECRLTKHRIRRFPRTRLLRCRNRAIVNEDHFNIRQRF